MKECVKLGLEWAEYDFDRYKLFLDEWKEEIQNKLDTDGKIFICLGKSKHKVKKKAEQCACENALKNIT